MRCKLQAHEGVTSCECVFMYCICIVYVYKYVFKYICIVCVPSVFGMYEVRMKCVRSANSSRCCLSRVCFHIFMCTRPNAGLRPAGPRWIVGGVQFSWVHFSRLASRLRRSARRGQIVFQKTYKTFCLYVFLQK